MRLLNPIERPSALPTAWAQVSAGAPQLPQAQMPRAAASYGTNGTTAFRGDDIATAKQPVDGVSGAPPRGRPV